MHCKAHFRLLAGGLFCLALISCGSSNGSPNADAPSIGISNIVNLPLPLDPVQSSASASLSSMRYHSNSGANTGIPLGQLSSNTFDSQSSLLACQTSFQAADAYALLSTGSIGYCAFKFLGDQVLAEIPELYDGNFHVFDLKMVMDGQVVTEASSRARVKIVRRNDSIRSLTIYLCGYGTNNQFNYINQTIAEDGSFSMLYKGTDGGDGDPSAAPGWHLATIDGNLSFEQSTDGDNNTTTGRFVGTKTMTAQQSWVDASNRYRYSQVQLQQTADSLGYQGYTYETNNGATLSIRTLSLAQLIDGNTGGNYNPGLLAIGNGGGSLLADASAIPSLPSGTVTEGWNGDTREVDDAAGQSFLDLIAGESPPALPSTPLTETLQGFNGDEGGGCDPEGQEVPAITLDISNVPSSCIPAFEDSPSDQYNCYENLHAQ